MDNSIQTYSPQRESIVLYQSNDGLLQLDVQVANDTVWLNRQQMASLFNRDVKTIGKHINNALKEELNLFVTNNATTDIAPTIAKFAIVQQEPNPVVAKFATTASDGKIYQVEYYNLDVILSVGYRVKSSRGIEFRRWANRVLKDYLLKGYAINQRLLHVEERIDSRLRVIENRLEDHQQQIDFFVQKKLPPIEKVFFEGQFFEARALLESIIKTATKRVIIIDAYIDAATFEMLDVRQDGVTADIYSSSLHTTLREAHNSATGRQPINTHKWTTPSHDRWLIVDDMLYHCGHSLKDMGQKMSAITLMGTKPETILNQIV